MRAAVNHILYLISENQKHGSMRYTSHNLLSTTFLESRHRRALFYKVSSSWCFYVRRNILQLSLFVDTYQLSTSKTVYAIDFSTFMNGIYIFLSASFIMTEHIQTFFNTTVFTGITIGLVSLGIGIYYEVFRRKRAKRYTTTMQKTEPSKNDNRSSIRA